jgi:hypothetical protein
MKKRVKWPVKELLDRGQRKMMRIWLRHTRKLSELEEELIHISEPRTKRNISDEEENRSDKDLVNSQVGENGLSSF